MMDGERQIPEALFNLQEDLKAFRESVNARLDLLEDGFRDAPEAWPKYQAELQRLRMNQQIEDFRHGRS